MSSLFDSESILSENEQWTKLEAEWKTIDLEVEIEDDVPHLKPMFSTLDLNGTTFDSSFLFKKVRRKVGRQLSKISTSSIEYDDFISHIQDDSRNDIDKQFYFVNGQITSAASVEDICEKIDDIFKSIEELSTATSTVKNRGSRNKTQKVPELVQCSFSATDLSFDDTVSQGTQFSAIDRNIEEAFEEAFEKFNSTIATIEGDSLNLNTVSTLVNKFSTVLSSPIIKCSPRRRRQCCEKFKELTEFWKNRAFECE